MGDYWKFFMEMKELQFVEWLWFIGFIGGFALLPLSAIAVMVQKRRLAKIFVISGAVGITVTMSIPGLLKGVW